MIKIITEKEFNEEVLEKKDDLIITVFFATWCGHCKDFGKVLETVNEKHNDKLSIVKIDVDKNPELVDTYGVEGYPSIFFIKNGDVQKKIEGSMSEGRLEDKIALYS